MAVRALCHLHQHHCECRDAEQCSEPAEPAAAAGDGSELGVGEVDGGEHQQEAGAGSGRDRAEIAGSGDQDREHRHQRQGGGISAPDLALVDARRLPLVRQDDRQLGGTEQVRIDRRSGGDDSADGQERETGTAEEGLSGGGQGVAFALRDLGGRQVALRHHHHEDVEQDRGQHAAIVGHWQRPGRSSDPVRGIGDQLEALVAEEDQHADRDHRAGADPVGRPQGLEREARAEQAGNDEQRQDGQLDQIEHALGALDQARAGEVDQGQDHDHAGRQRFAPASGSRWRP